jgi:hypothetical protein
MGKCESNRLRKVRPENWDRQLNALPFLPVIRILPISATPINEDHEPEVQSSKEQWQTQVHILESPASERAVGVPEMKFGKVGRPDEAGMFLSDRRRGVWGR